MTHDHQAISQHEATLRVPLRTASDDSPFVPSLTVSSLTPDAQCLEPALDDTFQEVEHILSQLKKESVPGDKNLRQAEQTAAILRRYLELTADGSHSLRTAAQVVGAPLNWFSGENSLLKKFQRNGVHALLPDRSTCNFQPSTFNPLPAWFIKAAQFFYLFSNFRREGGSVPEAILRTASLPNVPHGWTHGHASRLAKVLRSVCPFAANENGLPECPANLRAEILRRFNARKPIVPRSLARQIALPEAIVQRHRSPRAFALDNLSAPGSQRRYFNVQNGSRQIMLPGDWFGGDDATPGIAVCVPSVEINTPCSQRYGVLLGRFQWLAFHDCRTDKILAFDYIVRPRGSYRAEDILNGMGAVTRTHGIPRLGWQFEGGSWNSKLVKQAIQLLRCELWRTYSPHQKSIEAVFNKVWTRLAVQFPHADMGRYRNENEANCVLYENAKKGHADPRKYFPSINLVVKIFEEEIAFHNGRRILSSQYGQWIPDELFSQSCLAPRASRLRQFSNEMAWIFSPFSVERKVRGMIVGCKVPMFEDFSVPFEFSAPWLPLHRGKLVRLHFNPREPKCQAKLVLLENSGELKTGSVLGDAQLVGETAQHIRSVLAWATDDQRAGYLARQRTAQFISRRTRAIGTNGRIEYSLDEQRDGLGTITKIEKNLSAGRNNTKETVGCEEPAESRAGADSTSSPTPNASRLERENRARELEQFARNHQHLIV